MGYEKKEDYLQAVGQEIRWRRARRQLTRELSDHIADQEADFLSQGMEPQEAARRAVEEMGDPVEVGQSMNQLHRPKRCFSLPILALCASFAGLVCCGQWMDFYDNKGNQLLGLGIGLVLMGLLWLADLPAALKKLGRWVYGLVILCPLGVWTLFVLWPHHNSGVSSARFGLYLTLFFPLLFAALLLRLRGQGAWAVIAASLAAAWLAMPPIQFPNIGTAAILYGVMLFVLSAAVWNGWMGVKRRWLALPLLWTPGVLFLTAFFTSGLSTARFTYFFHPELDPTGYGYQWNTIRQTLDGLPFFFTSGALSPTQEAYLQSGLSHQSDFSLLTLTAQWGWVVMAVSLGVILLFGALALMRIRKLRSLSARLTAHAVVWTLLFQALLYWLAGFGYSPFYSMLPLPFFSYGPGFQMTDLALLGVLLSAFRMDALWQDIAPPREPFRLPPSLLLPE